MKTMLTFVVVLAAACGGSKTPAASGPGPSATATTPGAGEHANMSTEMTRFHDVLAPRWHADKGPQRKTDTCAAVPS